MDLVKLLIAAGANVNLKDLDGDTPLLVCEQPDVFKVLVEAGADAAAVNNAGDGILQKVFEEENETRILFLMENHYVNDPDFKFTPGQFELQFEEQEHGEGTMDAIAEDEEDEESGSTPP
jgi:hypothetical protein